LNQLKHEIKYVAEPTSSQGLGGCRHLACERYCYESKATIQTVINF
jgi:hypothetical protein